MEYCATDALCNNNILLQFECMLQVKNKDQYARNVAACSISPDLPFQQPEDMGQFLVSNGYAVAYRWVW